MRSNQKVEENKLGLKLNFGFPHYRAKKIVVNFIYGYQNLSGEKYKSNGKRISSIRHTSEEKNPKNIRKYHISGKNQSGPDSILTLTISLNQ